jgi:hypothetical protein
MVGWAPFLGSIEVGKTADLLIVDSSHSDPYANLIGSDESNVIAVLIDGLPRAGRATVIDPRTPGVELITIASQNIVLDVIDSAPHPLAGMSLSCAITTTANALARLPDVAREAQSMARLMSGASDHWRPLLDYDDLPEAGLFATVSLPKPSEVDPLTIEPISAADDDGYVVRLRSNINLPQWMKDAL